MLMMNGRVAILDLEKGESEARELDESGFTEAKSALDTGISLSKEYDGAIVLGAGILTGSLVPAACAGFVLQSSDEGNSKISMLLGLSAVELKMSGFDYLVLRGTAPEPGYVWARDGIAEFVRDPDLRPLDSWARTDRIRADQGDKRIQVLALGPWGDASHPSSRYVVNHWLAEDISGLAEDLGRRNIMAVSFRGMGELELADPDGHFSSCDAMRIEHLSQLDGNRGLASYWNGADVEHFSSLLHRPLGCFGCPFPCRSFVKVNEDPGQMALSEAEPGYLHYDISALEKSFTLGMDTREATESMIACARAGADTVTVLEATAAAGTVRSSAVRYTLSSPEKVPGSSERDTWKSFVPESEGEEVHLRCLSLGLCPRYWRRIGLEPVQTGQCVESALGRNLL